MLETIKSLIYPKHQIPFSSKFSNYVISILDKSVEVEFKYLLTHNKLDILGIDRLISSELSHRG